MKLIPATYIGDHEVIFNVGQLLASGRPLVNGFGEPLKPTLRNAVDHDLPAYGLRYGDTFMMPDYEVLGQTILHDPLQQNPSMIIGVGKIVKKEHEGLSEQELVNIGYEFQAGRSDFTPLDLLSGTKTSPDSVMPSVASLDVSSEVSDSPAQSENTEEVPVTQNTASGDVAEV